MSGLFWARACKGRRRAGIYKGFHPHPCSEGVSSCAEGGRGSVHFGMASGAASVTRQGRQEREEVMSWEVLWACHAPGFWQWGNHSDLTVRTLPSEVQGKKKCKPWRTHKCLWDFLVSLPHLEMESHFRSRGHLWEGSSQDCHLGLESAFIFLCRAIICHLIYCMKLFKGRGRSLKSNPCTKKSLMENSRGNRRWKNHKKMQPPNQSTHAAQCLGYHSTSCSSRNINLPEVPDPDH